MGRQALVDSLVLYARLHCRYCPEAGVAKASKKCLDLEVIVGQICLTLNLSFSSYGTLDDALFLGSYKVTRVYKHYVSVNLIVYL